MKAHCVRAKTKVSAEIFLFILMMSQEKRKQLIKVPQYENETKRTQNIMLETTISKRLHNLIARHITIWTKFLVFKSRKLFKIGLIVKNGSNVSWPAGLVLVDSQVLELQVILQSWDNFGQSLDHWEELWLASKPGVNVINMTQRSKKIIFQIEFLLLWLLTWFVNFPRHL